jgi:hypothetical protein
VVGVEGVVHGRVLVKDMASLSWAPNGDRHRGGRTGVMDEQE